MVDYHTREKISHSGKRISPETKSSVVFFFQSVIFFPKYGLECGILFPECDIFSKVWSSTITPSTKGSVFFFLLY